MQSQGVLVTAKLDNEICAKCCGIKINNSIITHSTIISPFLKKDLSDLHTNFYSPQITFEVLIQKQYNKRSKQKRNDIESYNATLEGFYEYKYLTNILESFTSLVYDKIDNENNEILKSLSLFILLKIDGNDQDNKPKKIKLEKESFQLGMEILVESTPFAAPSFFNSWSRGTVSKILDSENQLVLIDTRTAVGSEGAPIYSYHNKNQKNLLGMVICVLNHCEEDYVGLTLGCSILPILHFFYIIKTIPPTVKAKLELDTLKSSVVLIRCGKFWGSGVVIDSAKGVVLTCSHIIKTSDSPVFVLHQLLRQRLPAKVVYATPTDRPYDLAVLRIPPNPCLQQLNLSNSTPIKGGKVLSAGYSILSEYNAMGLGITISQGTVSRLERKGPLHVTSCIHAGASGGAILRPPNQLIGIIMCNSKVGKRVLPEFSMGLSVEDFYQPLKHYLETEDPECLNELTVTDNEVIMKWDLSLQSKL